MVKLLLIVLLAAPLLASDVVPCFETFESKWALPPCKEHDFNTTVIEAVRNGDHAAIDLLRQRYEQASTWRERHRLAGALLGKVADDSAIWNELVEQAEIALRVPRNGEKFTPEFEEWCAARGYKPYDYWWMARDALTFASEDPRARPLLLRALAESTDAVVVSDAIIGLTNQDDVAAVPAIEKALARFDHATASWMRAPLDYMRQRTVASTSSR